MSQPVKEARWLARWPWSSVLLCPGAPVARLRAARGLLMAGVGTLGSILQWQLGSGADRARRGIRRPAWGGSVRQPVHTGGRCVLSVLRAPASGCPVGVKWCGRRWTYRWPRRPGLLGRVWRPCRRSYFHLLPRDVREHSFLPHALLINVYFCKGEGGVAPGASLASRGFPSPRGTEAMDMTLLAAVPGRSLQPRCSPGHGQQPEGPCLQASSSCLPRPELSAARALLPDRAHVRVPLLGALGRLCFPRLSVSQASGACCPSLPSLPAVPPAVPSCCPPCRPSLLSLLPEAPGSQSLPSSPAPVRTEAGGLEGSCQLGSRGHVGLGWMWAGRW